MWTLIISNFIILSVIFYIGYSILTPRYKNKIIYILIFLIFFIVQNLTNLNGPTNMTTMYASIVFFLFLTMLFKGNIIEYVTIILFSLVSVTSSEFISMLVLNAFFGLNASTEMNSILYFTSLIISNALFLILSIYFIKFKEFYVSASLPNYMWIILLLPFSTIMLFMNISDYFSMIEYNKGILFIFLCLTASNYILLFIFYKALESFKLRQELYYQKEHNEIVKAELELLNQHYKSNFNLLHTLLHSYSTLKVLLDNNNIEELNEKLDELSTRTFKEFNSIYSESALLNVIISDKLNDLRELNIAIRTIMNYSEFEFFELYEQKFFFSNIIDLCILLCSKKLVGEKMIFIKSIKRESQVIVQIYCSSEKDFESVFIKFSSFKKLIDKYNGFITLNYSDVNKILNILILFA